MKSTTFTVRVDTGVKKRLERLAKSTGRSRSFLAAEAINDYLDVNEWQVAGIPGQGLGRFLWKRGRETSAQEFMNSVWSPEAVADLVALRA